MRHYSSFEIEKEIMQSTVKLTLSFTFKPEVRSSSSEMFVITKWTNPVLFCLGYLVQIK